MLQTILAAPAPGAGTTSIDPGKIASLTAIASGLVPRIVRLGGVSRRSLTSLMIDQFGGTDATGRWSMRDAYDALELAQVMMVADSGQLELDNDPYRTLELLERIAGSLPTQSYRSEQQVELQQFSTPLPLAWLAARAAALRAGDVVLEPSAGTGMLAAHGHRRGCAMALNERDPQRAALLEAAIGRPVSRHDAEFIDDALPADAAPTVVLINPPFSRSEQRGRDRHAGARHLRSALQRLALGGRCVAIMSPAFAPDAAGASGYEAVAKVVQPRAEITITGQPYAKHGTSISVRLCVFDKGWFGATDRATVTSLDKALDLVLALPPRLDEPTPPGTAVALSPTAPPRRTKRLFGSVSRGRLSAPAIEALVDGTPRLLDYEIFEAPPAAGEQIGIYVPWRLTRMAIPGASPHPDQLVESVAMSSIAPPAPHYRPLLPRAAVAALSDAQLETVIYAGQAFGRDLPGRHLPNNAGTLLEQSEAGHAYRMGFMLGDGTGVGKGQQVAACILDRWCQGHRRAVWISKSSALIEDARRDWAALGGLAIDIQPLDAFPFGSPITMAGGILFTTYATLRSQRDDAQSRLQQVIDWLGAEFEGVIAFDEAHELANAAGTQTRHGTQRGSEQGLAGVRLQNLLPRACVLYISATGATDPANLCYATRLGLWGPGSAFESRDAFMAAIASGGIAAMEIVARDLKALGLYTSRALTFRGVEYAPLEHRLTEDQIAVYDAYADAWSIIHQNLDAVLEATNIVDRMTGRSLNAQAKGAALSRFESAKQRFFGQVLIAMKLPTLIEAIEAHRADGQHAIVQLVTTAEAMLDRRLASLDADERARLDIELSPREYMIDYLMTAFPTRMLQVFIGTDGEPRSELMVDDSGHPVHSNEALRARDELVERLCAMPAIPCALDEIIRHFGVEEVAEVTGRTRRLLTDTESRQRIERRSVRSNLVEADAFMAGRKQILLFSDAGGTGRSYHADRNCGSADRRRVHFLLEPGWRASSAIQGLGRSNRTNQTSAPIFRPVTTDCRGERRFISTIARRLDSLGALTRGQRQTGGQNLFDPADNLESDYARDALAQWYHLLYRGKLKSTSLDAFTRMTGLRLTAEDGGLLESLPPIQRWLNRLLALRIATQNAIFEEYLALIEARIDEAREAGTLDVGVETISAERVELLEEQVLRRDPVTGAETKLCRLELHHRRRALPLARLLADWARSSLTAFLRNSRSGRVALKVPSWPILDDEGRSIPVWQLVRPAASDRIREGRLAESLWHPVDEAVFRRLWQAECDEIVGRLDIETINLATGLLLPVWNRLPDDDMRVWRIADQSGTAILGRIVSPAGFEKLASAFGVSVAIALSPGEVVEAARSRQGVPLPGLEPARLARARVNDDVRFEIRDFPPTRLEWLKSLGCFTEIIAYKTRVFVPVSRAEGIVAAIGQSAGAPLGSA
ncbi:strawberry notch family protein [Sphingomonas sp. MG17]|uniref:Strawberry notch family protein n=1 Tax=Sphingomonas tagetis TaxID=2949092 RepID=A0A9X2KM29_9SPHN|nr:strawberry notch family protein [Sphingomonas tagetis]MCP3732159.1 strawberry notch family protein [Sphingomonas tagetis]